MLSDRRKVLPEVPCFINVWLQIRRKTLQSREGVVSSSNSRVLLYNTVFRRVSTSFNPTCEFAVFNWDVDSDYRCLVLIPYVRNQICISSVCLFTLSLVAFSMSELVDYLWSESVIVLPTIF